MTTQKSRILLLAENTILETERLILRPLTLEDGTDFFEYASDEETMRYIFNPHTSLHQTKEFIANYYLTSPLGFYALEHKKNHRMIGVIEFRVEDKKHEGEIGYMLNKKYWRQGLTTEACLRILSLGFNTLRLEHISSGHDTGHIASGNVLKKVGMTFENITKDSHELKGKMVDTHFYGITRDAYLTSHPKKADLN
ncbi:GNAT family N-acetyltransferase [Carnobacterium jeotgali]|uniref:GNAT family N-acetyltransferase n=1 Tax=Carnobacterium jeotgali TaxID=545534 RepID=UPI003C710687